MARATAALLLPFALCQTYPDYGTPTFGGLSVTCVDDEACGGDVCDWLNLVAFRGGFASLAETRAFAVGRLRTLEAHLQELRFAPRYLDLLLGNITDTDCAFAPRDTDFRPWRLALDGLSDPENHRVLVDTTGGRLDARGRFAPGPQPGVFVANVHAAAPGPESFHHHQMLSIFVHFGTPPCQFGIDVDGSYDSATPACVSELTPESPMSFEILFTGSQWMHANWLLEPMAYKNARNCPHELAPAHYGDRGFMMRIFFPMNESDVPYPRAPNAPKPQLV